MKAYPADTIFNASLKRKAENWLAQKLISEEQHEAISKTYSRYSYTPNIFVKIGLFIFTCFIILASLGIYFLFFASGFNSMGDSFFMFTSLFFAAGCIFALETLIKSKHVYNAGSDEALLYVGLFSTVLFIFSMLDSFTTDSPLLFACLALPFLAFAVMRYADRIVTLALCFCIYAILFLAILKIGEIAKLIMPFALMVFSAFLYVQIKKLKRNPDLSYWQSCITVAEFVSLLIFYASGNYYVIRESSQSFFDLHLAIGQDIPMALLFYFFTASVPIVYIYFGLKQKDKTLLWSGLILVAASAVTFKYYFSLGHPEISLTIAGIILMLIAYFSIQYFKKPRYGITFEEETDANSFLRTNAEALIIAEGMTQKVPDTNQNGFEFGGGQSGGAGSGGTF
jgi:hypothetical protein